MRCRFGDKCNYLSDAGGQDEKEEDNFKEVMKNADMQCIKPSLSD